MTSTELSNSGLPDNLPLLTQVVETDTPDDLPTLTDVVTDAKDKQPAILASQENEPDTSGNKFQPITKQPIAAPETAAPPPRLLGEEELQQMLHYLKVHIETLLPEPPAPPPRALNEEELQQILQHLEAHLDTMLASKLSLHFEKLRDALNAHLDSKIQ